MPKTVALLVAILHALVLVGAEIPHTRFLLPVDYAGVVAGAHGSLWTTEFSVRNDNDHWVPIGPCGAAMPQTPPCPPESVAWPPLETTSPARTGLTSAGVNGRLVFIPTADVPHLQLNLQLRELSRGGTSTQLPIVPENAWHTGTIHLLNVTVPFDTRLSLRVYEMNLKAGAAVEVFVYRMRDHAELWRGTFSFEQTIFANIPGRPFAPNFVALHGFPVDVPFDDSIQIDVVPVGDGLQLWAFASITDNLTQHVTIVAP